MFPIENFGFRLTRTFLDANRIKSYEFGKNFVTFVLKKGEKFEYKYFNQFLSLEDDSFVDALKDTINIINEDSKSKVEI